jgi:hypothetical protein
MHPTRSPRDARVAARARWPIRVVPLSTAVRDDLSLVTTAEERLTMMWELTLDAWAVAGRTVPTYSRGDTPVRIIR